MRHPRLDLDVLQSFASGVELGSFARAAERLGRSTSAISIQLKKLEEQLGTPLLQKAGRGLVLTPAGEVMLGYARRLLELNDEAVLAVRGQSLAGTVRLGLQDDFGDGVLTAVLGQFSRAHPGVHLDVLVGRNREVMAAMRRGELDLALAWADESAPAFHDALGDYPLHWIGPRSGVVLPDGELALVALAAPCLIRSKAIHALEQADRRWRISYTGSGVSGVWSAVAAGLGLTVRTALALPPALHCLDASSGLPVLPALSLQLHRLHDTPEPQVQRLRDIIRAVVPSPRQPDLLDQR